MQQQTKAAKVLIVVNLCLLLAKKSHQLKVQKPQDAVPRPFLFLREEKLDKFPITPTKKLETPMLGYLLNAVE
ncbi:MAG: hypothetical protein ACM3KH_00635, partial [Thiobacillus sp.]